MSTSFYYTLVLCLLLLLSSIDTNMAARKIPSSAPSTIVRPLVSEAQDYVTMKPLFKHKHRVFRGKEVKNCLPKGFRHSSAPSRFVNYHTLGGSTAGCFSRKKPWCMVYAWELKKYGGDVCICFLGFHGAVVLCAYLNFYVFHHILRELIIRGLIIIILVMMIIFMV